MRRLAQTIFATILAVALPACNSSSALEEQQAFSNAKIDERLAAAMGTLEADGFSGFAAVARNGELIAFAEAGSADHASGRPFTPTTQIDIGSISKPITGLAASRLIAQGQMDPQATLGDFFEDVPTDKSAITIEQLLTHSAGFGGAHGFDLEPMTRAEMIGAAFAQELKFEPGTAYSYSNTGPSLVAAIIEDITGQEYEDHIRQEVLAPMGMSKTGYWQALDPETAESNSEYGPLAEASWGNLDPVSWSLIGNGGLASTADDLLTLGQAIASRSLDESTLTIWLDPRVDEGGGTRYGFGIGYQDLGELGEIHWHNGGNPAFQTEWWTLLDSGITFVVHRNGGAPSIEAALGPVIHAITGAEMQFAVGPGDLDMTSGSELPDTPEGDLARAFMQGIQSDQESWNQFVTNRMSAEFLAAFPLNQHQSQFAMLNGDLADRAISAYGIAEDAVHLRLSKSGAPDFHLVLMTVEEDGELKLSGLAAS